MESEIRIIKGISNRRRFQRNTPKIVWDFGMVYESEIYYSSAIKDDSPALEHSKGDTVDISEWVEFK